MPMRSIVCLIRCLGLLLLLSTAQAQTSDIETKVITVPKDSKNTVYRIAGDYSEKHNVLAIAMLRGKAHREDYDRFIPFFSKKLDSLGIPHMFFQRFLDDKPGTSFDYFIENEVNGPFRYDELIALLPSIKRDFQAAYKPKN